MMPLKFTLLLIYYTLFFSVAAEQYNASYHITTFFPRPPSPQYRSFFPKYAPRLVKASTVTCATTFTDYNTAYSAPPSSPEAQQLLSICYQHEQCILDNIPSHILANFNSATVVLGLMPTLLSTIAPSIAEMALLSVYRPGLSFLIALGAPSIWPTRLLEYNDPTRVLNGLENDARGTLLKVHILKRFKWATGLLSALQYVLLAGAVFNVLWTSLELGRNTILSWGCTNTFGPLLWTSLAGIVHLVAGFSFAYARRSVYNPTGGRDKESKRWTVSKGLWKLVSLLENEVTLCAEQTVGQYDDNVRVPRLAVVANVLAGCGGFIHLMFGIIIFSSLQLVSVWDVLNSVLCRYVASAVVCRLILVFEIGGLRRDAPSKG
jgi:hypothetical protein